MDEYNEIKLSIYEAFENDDISEDEKNILMESLLSKSMLKTVIKKNIGKTNISGDTVTLYHGSDSLYEELKSNAPDFGNLFQKPGLSLFCFADKESAIKWAGFTAIRNNTRDARKIYEQEKGIHVGLAYDPINKYGMTYYYPFFEEYYKSHPTTCYVYTITVNISDVGLGNDSTHDEYTVRRDTDIVPETIESFKLDSNTISNFLVSLPEAEYRKRTEYLRNVNARGFITSCFLINDYGYQRLKNKKIIDTIFFSDDFKNLGTDSESFRNMLKNNNINLYHLNPLKRLKYEIDKKKMERR